MKLLSMYNRYNVSVMVLVFVLSSAVSFFLIKQILKNEVDGSLLRVKAKIQSFVEQHDRLPEVNLLNDEMISFKRVAKPGRRDEFRSVKLFIKGIGRVHLCRQLIYTLNTRRALYQVSIINPLEGTSHLTRLILSVTIITILMLIIATFVMNRLIISKLWRPFYQSITEVSNFKINDAHVPDFPVTRIAEFNFMISSLKTATTNASENYRILKEFTENAAHEIQTPLAIIQSKLDLLVQQDLPSEHIESLRSAYGAIRKLSRVNQDLLLITKIENSQFEKKDHVRIKEHIELKVLEFKEIWQLKNLDLKVSLKEAILSISPELLEILIYNVLGNATKHNHNGGFIHIELDAGQLVVANSGSEKALNRERLFSRFYKEINNSENNGLGLSIIKQICEVSGIEPAYRYEDGTHRFCFSF